MKIQIYSIVGDQDCVTSDDGVIVFYIISKLLKNDENVTISFTNVRAMTSAFLYKAIGNLYGNFDHDFLKRKLSAENISIDDKVLLKKVTETAKEKFSNKNNL